MTAAGGGWGALTLRFGGYSGPSDLLAVLVREGDMAARVVPVGTLAAGAASLAADRSDVVVGQVHALADLTDVWRVRLWGLSGLARLAEPEEGAGAPAGVDPALTLAAAGLRSLEEEARRRMVRGPSAPPARRLGDAPDLAAAAAAVAARRGRREGAAGLWPLPERVPVMHHMRRFLSGLRQHARIRLVGDGASRGDTVAATLAALELVRRGRARLWQRRAYAPVTVVRPGRRRSAEGGR